MPMGIAASRLQPFLLSIDHQKNWFIDIVKFHVLVDIRDGLRRLTVTHDNIKIAVEKRCYRVRILKIVHMLYKTAFLWRMHTITW
jgi:hypothetical protein